MRLLKSYKPKHKPMKIEHTTFDAARFRPTFDVHLKPNTQERKRREQAVKEHGVYEYGSRKRSTRKYGSRKIRKNRRSRR